MKSLQKRWHMITMRLSNQEDRTEVAVCHQLIEKNVLLKEKRCAELGMKRIRPRTEPCGTPKRISAGLGL